MELHGGGVCTLPANGRRALGNVRRTRRTDHRRVKWQRLVSDLSSQHLREMRPEVRPPVLEQFVGAGASALACTGVKFGWPFRVLRSGNAAPFVPVNPIKRMFSARGHRVSCSRTICVLYLCADCDGLRVRWNNPIYPGVQMTDKDLEISNRSLY